MNAWACAGTGRYSSNRRGKKWDSGARPQTLDARLSYPVGRWGTVKGFQEGGDMVLQQCVK